MNLDLVLIKRGVSCGANHTVLGFPSFAPKFDHGERATHYAGPVGRADWLLGMRLPCFGRDVGFDVLVAMGASRFGSRTVLHYINRS